MVMIRVLREASFKPVLIQDVFEKVKKHYKGTFSRNVGSISRKMHTFKPIMIQILMQQICRCILANCPKVLLMLLTVPKQLPQLLVS